MGSNPQHTRIPVRRLLLPLMFTIRHVGHDAVARVIQFRQSREESRASRALFTAGVRHAWKIAWHSLRPRIQLRITETGKRCTLSLNRSGPPTAKQLGFSCVVTTE